MSVLDRLIASAGSWRGTSALQDPHTGKPDESASTMTVTPVLGGRFVRLDYTWSYQGAPQEGSLLVGFDKKKDTVTGHWIDSWHNGPRAMACTGPQPDGPTIVLRGSYTVPDSPDWRWRIDLTADGGQELRVVMYNVWPDGEQEDLAVEASYTRE